MVYIKVPLYCHLKPLLYCYTTAVLFCMRIDRTDAFSCLLSHFSADVLLPMCPHRLCSPLCSTLHLFHFIKASSLLGECASDDDSFALGEISLAFQPCVSDSSDIRGSLRVLFHQESWPLSQKKTAKADVHQKSLCEV